MDYLILVARLLLGLNFFIFGLNGFYNFIKLPEAKPEMNKFVQALADTGFLMNVVKILEIISGALILLNLFVPLALALLAPIIFVIVTAQFFLNRGKGELISVMTLVPFFILLLANREAFTPLFILSK